MPELVDLYSKGIKRKLKNYWAAWLPGTRFAIGDIGTLNGYLFEKVGTLGQLGLKYYEQEDADPSPLDISSEFDVTVSLKAVGETDSSFANIAVAEAGLKVEFGTQGAFILQAPEMFASEVGDRLNLQLQIIDAFRRGKWEKDWLVITYLLKAPSATVLISKSSNSSLELAIKAYLSGTVAALGAADAGISIRYKKGDTVNMIGGKNVTPLFQLSRLKTSFFSKPKLVTKSLRASDPSLADLTPSLVRGDRAIEQSLTFETLTDTELAEDGGRNNE
jgi:hypothetical protein